MKEKAVTRRLEDGVFNPPIITAQHLECNTPRGAHSSAHINLSFEHTAHCDAPIFKETEAHDVGHKSNEYEADTSIHESHQDVITHKESKLKKFYTNCDVLTNKKEELYVIISRTKPDVIALTEIYPKRINQDYKIQPSELQLQGYQMFLPPKAKEIAEEL